MLPGSPVGIQKCYPVTTCHANATHTANYTVMVVFLWLCLTVVVVCCGCVLWLCVVVVRRGCVLWLFFCGCACGFCVIVAVIVFAAVVMVFVVCVFVAVCL